MFVCFLHFRVCTGVFHKGVLLFFCCMILTTTRCIEKKPICVCVCVWTVTVSYIKTNVCIEQSKCWCAWHCKAFISLVCYWVCVSDDKPVVKIPIQMSRDHVMSVVTVSELRWGLVIVCRFLVMDVWSNCSSRGQTTPVLTADSMIISPPAQLVCGVVSCLSPPVWPQRCLSAPGRTLPPFLGLLSCWITKFY